MKVMHFPAVDFIGMSTTSPSGEWLIAWSEGSSRDSRDGKGSYVLYNNKLNQIIHHDKIERPGKAAVANNGSFCIENWQVSQEPTGVFLVFTSKGEQLISRKFESNIRNSAISNNGLYAICHTANSKNGGDGNKLTVFDLKNKCEFFSVVTQTKCANKYRFDEERAEFYVVIDEMGEFKYSSDGKFLDSDRYARACLTAESFTDILNKIETTVKAGIKNEETETLLASINKARDLGADRFPFWKAKALKLQATIHVTTNNHKIALEYFEEALRLDPKCGVKRNIAQLKKHIETNKI